MSHLFVESTNKQKQGPQTRRYRERRQGCGWAKWLKVGKRYKGLVIKQVSPGDVTYSLMTEINATMLSHWKALARLGLESVHLKRNMHNINVWGQMLTRLVIILQYIHRSNYYVVLSFLLYKDQTDYLKQL